MHNISVFFIMALFMFKIDTSIDKRHYERKKNKVWDNFIKDIPKIKEEFKLDTLNLEK